MLIKIIIIIVLLLLFYYVTTINIEKFVSNNYTNTNEYSWERNNINSKLPYNIIMKNNNDLYYDIGNDELDLKFKTAFEIDSNKIIKTIEGNDWTKWVNSKTSNNKKDLNDYFNNFLKYFKMMIKMPIFDLPNDNTNRFKIKDTVLLRYKSNKNNTKELLLEIDLVITRNNKPLSKHLKILTITDGNYNKIIMANVVGVINEFELSKTYGSIDDVKNYKEFTPQFTYKYDLNNYIIDTNDKLLHSEIEYNLYNKLLKDL